MTDTSTAAPPAPTSDSFDADARAAEREQKGVTAGGRTFKPVRKTTAVMRDVRRIGRDQERANRRAIRLEREAEAKLEAAEKEENTEAAEALEAEADTLSEQADALRDQATAQTFVMLARLVADGDTHPEPAFLEEHVDLADAQELAEFLMPRELTEPDPTPPTETSTS